MGLKASEIIAHPAYDTVEWDLPPSQQGYCEVAKKRAGGPFKLYWEVHGEGDIKCVVCINSLEEEGVSFHLSALHICTRGFGGMAVSQVLGERSLYQPGARCCNSEDPFPCGARG